MNKIDIMISSTVKDLIAERDALSKVFSQIPFVNLVGAHPLNTAAISSNSNLATISMAKNCDLYILVLGNRFGYELKDGRSATEIEFDAAFEEDPTKVLVFKKNTADTIDDKQKLFIERVSDYYSGYWITSFNYSHELQDFAMHSFSIWLKERASLGTNQSYLDHFVRLAKQFKPEPNSEVLYKVTKDDVELEYSYFGKTYDIHFKRSQIYKNFWGSIYELQSFFQNLKKM